MAAVRTEVDARAVHKHDPLLVRTFKLHTGDNRFKAKRLAQGKKLKPRRYTIRELYKGKRLAQGVGRDDRQVLTCVRSVPLRWASDMERCAVAPGESGSAARRVFPAGSNSVSLVLRALGRSIGFRRRRTAEPSDLRPYGLFEDTGIALSDHSFRLVCR